MIPAAQLLGSPCQWFALQREEKASLRLKSEVTLSFLNLSRNSVRLSYQAATLVPKAPLETNCGKVPYMQAKGVPLFLWSNPRVPSKQGTNSGLCPYGVPQDI